MNSKIRQKLEFIEKRELKSEEIIDIRTKKMIKKIHK
jgi:hypothetical protein